ncbi:hypothetical protein GALL_132420 [mine drainage metagenome]|uniref:Glycosyl transferase n=1 Tax=mine drainage metagenome TaxID=410659 RepID=A0A1J5SSH6_9ZZZZ
MRFQLDHDWQGNMSTPRARVGESAKTHLLLVLCGIWILLGLIGHSPWKPFESTSISIIKTILDGSNLIAPLPIGSSSLDSPPLYYLCAALSAKLLSSFLAIHDAARLTNAIWMTILLLMTGMTGRELWERGSGRHAAFIMIGTIGLIISSHSISPEIAGLACTAAGLYALALCKRRPWRSSLLMAAAISAGFLSNGLLPLIIIMSSALVLPLLFKTWRTRNYLIVISTAFVVATPPIVAWLLLLHYHAPALLSDWWHNNLNSFSHLNHLYFLRILIWYAWPALPLALWSLWRYRHQFIQKPKFQLLSVYFTTSLLFLGLGATTKDINALPLLLPLVALGAGSVEHLKRGAAAALNWFGITLFGLIGGLIWLGWTAMITGHPAQIKERMQFLSGANELSFNWLTFLIALAITIIWLSVCIRAKQTNKSAVTNWAVGMTFGWSLLMTLWLPLIDSAKSYQSVFTSLNTTIYGQQSCINSLDVGLPERRLFNYYTNITLLPVEDTKQLNCTLYLIEDSRGISKMQPSDEWKLIWRGKRPADRKESFRLYQVQR